MTSMAMLAPIASRPEQSRGRLHPEPESPTRSAFQRDRDRVIHSAAFRRLKYKTQVFVYHEGDYYRTRLTHSLEVAQIARSISRNLALNEDLAEALALAHDLGHPPFGHAGEDALKDRMQGFGGFDHNAQTLRILTELERRYAAFDGLNLTWESLEGTVKHNGPLTGPLAARAAGPGGAALPAAIVRYESRHALELDTFPGPEAQVAALSDDIAYNNHDIDDGLRANLFSLEDLADLPMIGPILKRVSDRHPGLERERLIHETIRRMIDAMVTDTLAETRRRLGEDRPDSAAAVRGMARPLVAFSREMHAADKVIREFLFRRMYRHYKVNRMSAQAHRVVTDLFDLYAGAPSCLPDAWRVRTDGPGTQATAGAVADYIAGLTDRSALDEHHQLFNLYAKI